MAAQRVFAFEEGSKEQKDLLGGKGANLAEMTKLGLPVPPGFTLSTDACRDHMKVGTLDDDLVTEVAEALAALEARMGKTLGDASDPLLVSVRSGAKFSMPGMMDTILNLGLNDDSVEGVARHSGDERFAWDSYRRFVQMFAKTALGVEGHLFEDEITALLKKRKAPSEATLAPKDLKKLTDRFKKLVKEHAGIEFPQDPREQLRHAIEAVFRSWDSRPAREYRKVEHIPDDLGTAVNVQAMVFGNRGDDSGTGVAFTRDPATGEHRRYGDFLKNAQGEDVVAGNRVTQKLDEMVTDFPEPHRRLLDVMGKLERHYRDMCDIEFTIEQGRLWLLQVRVGKRTAAAALRIAVEMVGEGLIDEREAVLRVKPSQLDQLLHPQFDPAVEVEVLTEGLNASPGAAVGKVVFTADEAATQAAAGEKVVLVRPETSPDDVHGMIVSQGILTSRGGLVSHAAVVARGWGKPAVCGASGMHIDLKARRFTVDGTEVKEGDVVSIDGTDGRVVLGEVPLIKPEITDEFETLLSWGDRFRRLTVRANADLAEDAKAARDFGAEGIGLARTEHMFLGARLPLVQDMFAAAHERDEEALHEALDALAVQQKEDFLGLLEAMDGLPVTVRLLDPPLHEFLPDIEELREATERRRVKKAERERARRLLATAEDWRESNPMLGIRGARLHVLIPELPRMQVRALMQAAVERKRAGGDPQVEIMIPLTVNREELALLARWTRETAEEVMTAEGVRVDYLVGTMVETPRAALVAGEIAEVAEFFSFGTNDLTQMTFGFSRDDVEGRMMNRYLEEHLLPLNPFETLDRDGVGRLVRLAVEEGRRSRGAIKLGICGEHGGDPDSVAFCHEAGLDYVSASTFRIPTARLAAAHAALAEDSSRSI